MKWIFLCFILIIGSLAQAKAADEFMLTCRKLGPWVRIADSDYCSCLRGNLAYIAKNKKDFKANQVKTYLRGLYLTKNKKSDRRRLASIPDPKTRSLFQAVSKVCEKNPLYRKPQTFIGNKTNSAETSLPMFVPL